MERRMERKGRVIVGRGGWRGGWRGRGGQGDNMGECG